MLSTTFRAELNKLPLQDKLEVFEAIRVSIAPSAEDDFPELSSGQVQELLHRAEYAASNPSAGRPWVDIKKDLQISGVL